MGRRPVHTFQKVGVWGGFATSDPHPNCKVPVKHVLAEELLYQGKTQQFWEHLMNIEALAIDKDNAEGY